MAGGQLGEMDCWLAPLKEREPNAENSGKAWSDTPFGRIRTTSQGLRRLGEQFGIMVRYGRNAGRLDPKPSPFLSFSFLG